MQKNNGFVIVASNQKRFLNSANMLANSVKEYWPDADLTLFTEDRWIEDADPDFDQVFGGAPKHHRAKLWALSQTPYKNLTVYLDADMECAHEDVSTIFNQMPEDADILITKIRSYAGKEAKFPDGEMVDHGGFFMYRNNPKTIEFMNQWWLRYEQQYLAEQGIVDPKTIGLDEELHPRHLWYWDQFTFWWLQNKTEYAINKQYFPDDARWNFVWAYRDDETDKPIIFHHHTLPQTNLE